jgi:hypothetical protein
MLRCPMNDEALDELTIAHAIIEQMMRYIPRDQHGELARDLSRVHNGEGMLRYHERAAVISRSNDAKKRLA